MGAYLSEPKKDKELESGENGNTLYSVAAMQGWRTEMEDAHLALLGMQGWPNCSIFGVFDGHGGKEVAKFCALHLADELVQNEYFLKGNFERALKSTYLRMDELMMEDASKQELAELAGHAPEGDDADMFPDIGNTELPDILKQALQATRQEPQQHFQLRANQVTSFPLTDCNESEEEDGEEEAAGRAECIMEHEEDDDDDDDEPFEDAVEEIEGSPLAPSNNRFYRGIPAGRLPPEDVRNGLVEDDANGVDDLPEVLSDEEVVETDSPQTPLNVTLRRDVLGGAGRAADAMDGTDPEESGPYAGCTAIVALVIGRKLVVANAGDSRCVLSRRGVAVPMSKDHKPTDPLEDERIRKAGGFVAEGRVNGSLNLSRALGDMEYKRNKELPAEEQMVSACPDVRILELKRGDDFCILACDGIWDVLTEQQAVDFVYERLARGIPVDHIVQQMCDACLADNTEGTGEGCDNMTAMVVVFRKVATLKGVRLSEKSSPSGSVQREDNQGRIQRSRRP